MLLPMAKTMCERIQSCSDPEEEGVGQVFWIPPLEHRKFYSVVGNVYDYRCASDCRSRGREFYPGPIQYFRGD